MLADHELATSTLAVRLAASVRSAPYDAVVAGLAVVTGPLHGAAAAEAHRFLAECAADGVAAVVTRRLANGERLPGFGHKIYAGDDPSPRPPAGGGVAAARPARTRPVSSTRWSPRPACG